MSVDWLSDLESWSSAIRNVFLVIGGMLALWFARKRFVVADRRAKTAQRSLLNERYQKGAEMLGSKVLMVRLGGIDVLGDLAREHPEDYHTKCMRLLCAFVRHPTGLEDAQDEGGNDCTRPREDIQEALTTIKARTPAQIEKEKQENFKLNLDHANLKLAQLTGADLTEANLTQTKLIHAWLEGANLNDADMFGTNLYGANLRGAQLKRAKTFGANLNDAWLEDANLAGANLKFTLINGANLTGADLSNCTGLTQKLLDKARADPNYPPKLEGAVDTLNGAPLVWKEAS